MDLAFPHGIIAVLVVLDRSIMCRGLVPVCAGQRGRGWGCFSIDWRVTMVIPVRLAAMMFSTDGVSVGLLMLRLHNSS